MCFIIIGFVILKYLVFNYFDLYLSLSLETFLNDYKNEIYQLKRRDAR